MRKLALGPMTAAICQKCGKKVGVSLLAIWTVILFLATVIASGLVEATALKVAIWVGGAVVIGVFHLRWVPLIPK